MLRLLLGIFGVEIRHTVQRAGITALLFFIAALFLGAAIIAFIVAGYILLAVRYDPIVAAFIIAALCLVGALIFFLIAYMRTRRRRRPAGYGAVSSLMGVPPVTPPGAVPPLGTVGAPPSPSASTVIAVAAGAALLGLILGRRI